MVQMPVRQDHAVEQAVVDVPPQLGKRARAKVDDDPRCATLDEITAAPLSRIWAGGAAPQYRELHPFRFLSARPHFVLIARIVTEPVWSQVGEWSEGATDSLRVLVPKIRYGKAGFLTAPSRGAYTLADACYEGILGAIHDKTLGDSAVSRT
jgi:hypothetical protein